MSNNAKQNFDGAVVIALGSNMRGQYRSVQALLEGALERFPRVGLQITQASRWWRSKAWPDNSNPDYLNGVVLVETGHDAESALHSLLALEVEFGRVRTTPNSPRSLDLDLIAHGRQRIVRPDLTLPHPRARDRLFVMGPLAELAPGWTHPVTGETAISLSASATIGRDATPILHCKMPARDL